MSSSDTVRALCTRCGKSWPAETMSCASCGAELGGETVLDDVHAVDTALLAAPRPSATTSQADTAPDAAAFPSEPPLAAAVCGLRQRFAAAVCGSGSGSRQRQRFAAAAAVRGSGSR